MKICDKQSAFLWSQNRVQTAQFVRGFQQLIPKEWTDMFNGISGILLYTPIANREVYFYSICLTKYLYVSA
jgi:hypothetical protein